MVAVLFGEENDPGKIFSSSSSPEKSCRAEVDPEAVRNIRRQQEDRLRGDEIKEQKRGNENETNDVDPTP